MTQPKSVLCSGVPMIEGWPWLVAVTLSTGISADGARSKTFLMMRTRSSSICILALLLAFSSATLHGQACASWHDPSAHKVQFVTVRDGVRLEVLDWGGSGRPVVLLAGYSTAHVYDELAPKLTDSAHVYGITRRGLGNSSKPPGGYTARDSAEDVLQVLDALKLEKPILAGHSFGGQDLSVIGAMHPDRVGGLVYLDSAEDIRAFSALL